MSDEQDPASKTEDPTQKRLNEAENKGQIAKSQELNHWFMLMGVALAIVLFGPGISEKIVGIAGEAIGNAHAVPTDGGHLTLLLERSGYALLIILGPLLGLLMFAGLAGNVLQHRPIISGQRLKPELSKISPLKGLKKIVSIHNLVEFGKGILKLGVVTAVIGFFVWPDRDILPQLVAVDLIKIVHIVEHEAMQMLIATIAAMFVIGGVDFIFQRYELLKNLKMSKQEVKDEHKQSEGDPAIKGRIRSVRLERARRRMMANVPKADVVITNPTHYAVALAYKQQSMGAPKVIAKGVDAVALRIIALAKENDVPVVENPPVARALFAAVDLDEEIPVEHYKAVAQIISYVMRLKKRWQPSRRGATHERRPAVH